MLTKFRNSRRLQCVAVLLAGMLLVGFAHVPILREIASFLITEDSLEPAAAIVAWEATRRFARWKQQNFIAPGGRRK